MSNPMSVIKPIAAVVLAVIAAGAAWAASGENSSPSKAQAAPASAAPGPTVMTQELVRLPDGSFTVRFVMKPVALPGDPATETPDGAVIVPENAQGGEGAPAPGRGSGRAGRSSGGAGGGGGGGGRSFAHGGGGGGGGSGGGGGGKGGGGGGQSATARGAGSPVTARSEPRFDEATPVKLAANPPRTGVTNPTAALGGDGDSGGVLDETGWAAENGQPAAAPTGLVATDRGNHLHVDLTWDGPAEPGVTYKIEKRTYDTSAGWSSPMVVTAVQGRTDAAVLTGPGTFQFRVLADSGNGNAAAGDWVQITIAAQGPSGPGVPGNVTATDIGNRTARVSWTVQQAAAATFQIERTPAFSTGLKSVSGTVTNYIDPCGAGTFAYRVRAVAGDGAQTGFSGWSTVTISDTAPSAPTGLAAADMNNERDVELSWTPPSTGNATSIQIEHQFKDIDGVWMTTPTMQVAGDAEGATMHAWGGDHKYRVKAVNSSGSSTPTGWIGAFVASGWTQFTPSADTRIVYVSSSEGNDANDGLSRGTAKRTIAAGFALLRHTYPDWMLLKRGDVWDESLGHWIKSGRSPSEKMIVATYGAALDRPTLRTGVGDGFSRSGGGGSPPRIDFIAIAGLHMLPNLRTSESPTGFRWIDAGGNVLLEDCLIEGYCNNISIQGFTGRVDAVRINRCLLLDSYSMSSHSQGMFASRVDGLQVDGCTFDHNGWKEGVDPPTIFNHNIYIQVDCTNVNIMNIISARASSHGAQLRPGGTITNSLFVRDPIGFLLGTGGADGGGHDPTSPISAVAKYNVVVEGRDMDVGAPRGFGVDMLYLSSGVFQYNIIKDQGISTSPIAVHLDGSQGDGNHNITICDNAIINWNGSVLLNGSAAQLSGIVFERNVLQSQGGGRPLVAVDDATNIGAVAFRNNRYWAPNHPVGSLMRIGSTTMSFESWRNAVPDTTSVLAEADLVDPSVSITNYLQDVLDVEGDAETFLGLAREQRRLDWDARLWAPSVGTYFRAGIGYPEPPPP